MMEPMAQELKCPKAVEATHNLIRKSSQDWDVPKGGRDHKGESRQVT